MNFISIEAREALSGLDIPISREAVADLVTALINLLDDLDGDENLEPSLAGFQGATDDREGDDVQDEPHDPEDDGGGIDVSWPERQGPIALMANAREDDEDDGIAEPSLGAPEITYSPPAFYLTGLFAAAFPFGSQVQWARGYGDDTEQVDEDGGGDVDNEFTLGWSEAESLTGALSVGFGLGGENDTESDDEGDDVDTSEGDDVTPGSGELGIAELTLGDHRRMAAAGYSI